MANSQPTYENLEATYAQLNPQQRAALAQEFIQGFQQSGNPRSQPFTSMDSNAVTPQQLAAMHQHARQEHPGFLGHVMRHPVATAVLGGFAAYEIDKHVLKR